MLSKILLKEGDVFYRIRNGRKKSYYACVCLGYNPTKLSYEYYIRGRSKKTFFYIFQFVDDKKKKYYLNKIEMYMDYDDQLDNLSEPFRREIIKSKKKSPHYWI